MKNYFNTDTQSSECKNEQYLSKLDDAVNDLVDNGGYEYLGKGKDGKAKFGNTPINAKL